MNNNRDTRIVAICVVLISLSLVWWFAIFVFNPHNWNTANLVGVIGFNTGVFLQTLFILWLSPQRKEHVMYQVKVALYNVIVWLRNLPRGIQRLQYKRFAQTEDTYNRQVERYNNTI